MAVAIRNDELRQDAIRERDEARQSAMEKINDDSTVHPWVIRIHELEQQLADQRAEAQAHAQEARTQRATVHEIYQLITGATGEPGDWNGAEPIRKALDDQRAAMDGLAGALRAMLNTHGMHGPCESNSCKRCDKAYQQANAALAAAEGKKE